MSLVIKHSIMLGAARYKDRAGIKPPCAIEWAVKDNTLLKEMRTNKKEKGDLQSEKFVV